MLTLTATAAMGSTFSGWGGGGCSGTGTCMVTVNAATTVTATFTGGPVTLVAVQSRKTHGGAGTLGLPVDTVPVIGGAVTVESRISGATAANFKFDVNATGAVNASDISAVKARSGLTLP